jgi:hypothetical protein
LVVKKIHVEFDAHVEDNVPEEAVETDLCDIINGEIESLSIPYELVVDGEIVVESRE